MPRPALAVALAVTALAPACAPGADDRAPTARIDARPAYLPLDDDYHTDLTLDGSASSDPLADPAARAPLAYAWSIDDPMVVFVTGSPTSARPVVRLAAHAPTRVTLAVSAPSGTSSAQAYVGVTLPSR